MPWNNTQPSWLRDMNPWHAFAEANQAMNEAVIAPLRYQQAQNVLKKQVLDIAHAGIENQLESKRLDFEMQTMPDKVAQVQQVTKQQQNALDLENTRREGASLLFDYAATNAKKLGSWEYTQGLNELVKGNRMLLLTPEFQDLWKQNETAKRRAEVLGIPGGEPSPTGTIPGPKLPPGASWKDPVTGIDYKGPSDDSVTKLIKDKENAENKLQALVKQHADAPEGPAKVELQKQVQRAADEVQAYDAKLKGQSTEISTTNADGTTTSVRIGSGGNVPGTSGPVTGNIQQGMVSRGLGTKVSVQVAKYENAMDLTKFLEDNLTASDVGIAGNINEAISRVGGQFNPALVKHKVQLDRAKIRQLRNSVEKEIPEGGRETKTQREDILASLPETGLFESEGTARDALQATRELLASRARNYAGELGRVPLVSMSKDEMNKSLEVEYNAVKDKVRLGLISPEQGNAMVQSIWKEYQDAAKRFLPSK